MNSKKEIALGSVQETLLLPLWGRAVESKKSKPLLTDNLALSIIDRLPYDFSIISKNINKLSQIAWIARSIYFDKKIKAFMRNNPYATIVNIGCGLDTTFERVDNGKIQWIDLDLPDSMALRKKYISETARRKFVSMSVFNTDWYREIGNTDKVMLLIAGVLYYFDEAEVKKLFGNFHNAIPGTEMVFDYLSTRGIKIANRNVIKKGGMDKSASLKWGINNILEIEKWDNNIKVIGNMPMYGEHKKNYPLIKRVGMNISDILKLSSLAHVKIN